MASATSYLLSTHFQFLAEVWALLLGHNRFEEEYVDIHLCKLSLALYFSVIQFKLVG